MTEAPQAGTVSHGTLRTCDVLPAFLDTLCRFDPGRYSTLVLALDAEYVRSETPIGIVCYCVGYTKGIDLCDDDAWWDSDRASELVAEVVDLLCDLAPPGHWFGAHEGDGSDFGFWPVGDDDESLETPCAAV